jgi:hypothetical protein
MRDPSRDTNCGKQSSQKWILLPTLRQDAETLILRCSKRKFFSKVPKKPIRYLTTIHSVLPFDKWGMDLLGPLPPTSDGHGPGWPGPEPLETGTGTGTFVTGSEPEPNRGTVNPPEKSCRNRGTAGKNRKNRTKEPRTGSPAPPVQWNRPEP